MTTYRQLTNRQPTNLRRSRTTVTPRYVFPQLVTTLAPPRDSLGPMSIHIAGITVSWPKALAVCASLVGGPFAASEWVDRKIESHAAHPHPTALPLEQYRDDRQLLLDEIRENRALLQQLLRERAARHP